MSEEECREEIKISLLHDFILIIQISVPNLLLAAEVVAQNDISKGGKKNLLLSPYKGGNLHFDE